MDIGAWLRGLGLGQYESAFRDSEIEADVLSELTETDLEKLGLPLDPENESSGQFRIWAIRIRRRESLALHPLYPPGMRLSVVN